MSELITHEPATIKEVFSKENGLDPVLDKIRELVEEFEADVATAKGRKEIASFAHSIAKSKTYIDNLGKDLVTELKELPKKIDNERKRVRDTLDKWKDEVRRPLTEWEDAESERVQKHQNDIATIESFKNVTFEQSSQDIRAAIQDLKNLVGGKAWEEFEDRAQSVIHLVNEHLSLTLEKSIKREEDEAELERLRKEVEERKAKEREEELKREAAEKARLEAEEKARLEREKIEREKREAQERALAEENKRKVAEKKAEEDRLAAIEREKEAQARAQAEAIEAKKKAEAEKQAAIEAERRRLEEENRKKKEAEEKRAANIAHQKKINQVILNKLAALGVSEELGKAIVTSAVRGELGQLKVIY